MKELKHFFVTILFLMIGWSGSLCADILKSGSAVVTGFSGTRQQGPNLAIDPQGAVLKVFDLTNLGPADGELVTPPVLFQLTAESVGQVFGIALDNAVPPNIYLTATSAYGLHIVIPDQDGDGFPETIKEGAPDARFMPGQFGPGGSAGSVWKIDSRSGKVTLFADLKNRGIPNGGAALGNIAFDVEHGQFFVSDLDSGVIHRLDLDGNELGTFDHGLEGRTAAGMDAITDDGSVAAITQSSFQVDDARSWGLTDMRRLVWGLAVYEGRLYYAVGDGPQIWSVGLDANGDFLSDARLEIEAVPGGMPVSDILFTSDGTMIVAQRGGLLGGSNFRKFQSPGVNGVYRYTRQSDGSWNTQPDLYSIGMLPDYRNGAGGVGSSCDNILWSTGDNLLAAKSTASSDTANVVHGLQGNDISLVQPQNTPPTRSWFIDFDNLFTDADKSGQVGDVEIYRLCPQIPPVVSLPPVTITPPIHKVGHHKVPIVRPVTIGCPTGTYWNGWRCVPRTIYRCLNGFFWNGLRCILRPGCGPYYHWNGWRCVPNVNWHRCPPYYHWNGWRCVPNINWHRCPPHYHWNGWRCIPNANWHRCPPHYHWNGWRCIPNANWHRCPPHYHWNGWRCIPDANWHRCPPRYHWNGRRCIPNVPPAHHCAKNYHWNGRRCVPNVPPGHHCAKNYHWNGRRCVPNVPPGHHCAKNYHWNGRRCVPNVPAGHYCPLHYHWNGRRCIPNRRILFRNTTPKSSAKKTHPIHSTTHRREITPHSSHTAHPRKHSLQNPPRHPHRIYRSRPVIHHVHKPSVHPHHKKPHRHPGKKKNTSEENGDSSQ